MTTPNSGGGIVADQATITSMVLAFAETQSECQAAETAVDSAASSLASAWKSDSAAPRYFEAINMWMEGFHEVRQGLNMLNGNMETYSRLTTTTEDDNALTAAWATGA